MTTAAATLVLLLAALACGAGPSRLQEGNRDSSAVPVVGGADTTVVISSDPALRAKVQDLLPDLANRARMELVQPVRVERRSREELERYLRAQLDEEMPLDRARHLTASYALLGLVPPDLDLRALLLSVYTEQVAGFYDPDSAALFVMDDMAVDLLEPVLVHELVHAVQDQTANLDSLTAAERGNDRQVAAQAAIEGHATLVMLEYMAEKMRGAPVDLTQLPDFSQALGPALESMRGQYPALAGAPRIIQESLLFPYLKGAGYVMALWNSRPGRPPPFGEALPQSTEQVLEPAKALSDHPDPPTEIRLAIQGEGSVVYANSLGQAELEVLLQEHLGSEGRVLARGWDGDRYALIELPAHGGGDPEGGGEGLAWVSVWDSREARDRFEDGLRETLPAWGLPAVLESVEVEGRPGLLLRLALPPDLQVSVTEGPTR